MTKKHSSDMNEDAFSLLEMSFRVLIQNMLIDPQTHFIVMNSAHHPHIDNKMI